MTRRPGRGFKSSQEERFTTHKPRRKKNGRRRRFMDSLLKRIAVLEEERDRLVSARGRRLAEESEVVQTHSSRRKRRRKEALHRERIRQRESREELTHHTRENSRNLGNRSPEDGDGGPVPERRRLTEEPHSKNDLEWRKKKKNKRKRKEMTCFSCKKAGHIARACKMNQGSTKAKKIDSQRRIRMLETIDELRGWRATFGKKAPAPERRKKPEGIGEKEGEVQDEEAHLRNRPREHLDITSHIYGNE